jgi:hypothetical protein
LFKLSTYKLTISNIAAAAEAEQQQQQQQQQQQGTVQQHTIT